MLLFSPSFQRFLCFVSTRFILLTKTLLIPSLEPTQTFCEHFCRHEITESQLLSMKNKNNIVTLPTDWKTHQPTARKLQQNKILNRKIWRNKQKWDPDGKIDHKHMLKSFHNLFIQPRFSNHCAAQWTTMHGKSWTDYSATRNWVWQIYFIKSVFNSRSPYSDIKRKQTLLRSRLQKVWSKASIRWK